MDDFLIQHRGFSPSKFAQSLSLKRTRIDFWALMLAGLGVLAIMGAWS